jgi:hypothetical protein
MTPLLFPFTHLAPEMIACAARFFPHLSVYQPVGGRLPDDLQTWVRDGFLRIRVPVTDQDGTVVSAADEYQLWVRQHQPGKDIRTILPDSARRVPFFDDSAPSQILAELRAGQEGAAGASPRLFNARLFLCLAQQLDLHDREVQLRLKRAEADSNALMDELNPGDGPDAFSGLANLGAPPAAAFDFMLPERLAAWTQLFLADRLDDALLLTTSLSVFTDAIRSRDEARPLARLNLDEGSEPEASPGQGRQASLLDEIERAAREAFQAPASAAGNPDFPPGDKAELTIYLIPDADLRPFLAELAGVPHSAPADRPSQGVVVGFLDPGNSVKKPF